MKKILMFILCVFILAGCIKGDTKTDEAIETFDSLRMINDIKEFNEDEKSKDLYRAFTLIPIKVDEKDKEVDVFLYMRNGDFSCKDGIFNEESGSSMPIKLIYEKNDSDYKLSNIIYPKDGSDNYSSIKEMAGNDKDAIKKVMDLDGKVTRNMNDDLCEDLLREAKERGLEDFTHNLEDVPGYERDVIYIKSGPNHIEGTVEIAKKYDYLKAKENKEELNWPHCRGVVYNEKTKIAINTIIDYFGE